MTVRPWRTSRRTTADPMKPAPPVTRMVCIALSLVLERTVEVRQQGRDAVLVRQGRRGGEIRPVDTDRGIVPADRALVLLRPGRAYLVKHLGVGDEGHETVREADRD